jgi:hypothetical protein
MPKNFGTPPVSGYLDPVGRAWETVVFEAGKPVLDRELNLGQDIDVDAAQEALRQLMPSGWLASDPLTATNPVSAIFSASSAPVNWIQIPALVAHVNGWIIKVQNTNYYLAGSGANRVNLGAPPSGAGAQRTDLVILEVWRRLIKSGNAAGKSPGLGTVPVAPRIWQQGNVATLITPSSNDTTLNYPDDITDTAVGTETTARVQIQYRLRVVQNVDLLNSLSGMNGVTARTVPATYVTPGPYEADGSVTSLAYSSQSANGDAGLWRAGDGVPTNALGTVDGYMYAIPLLGVFRRNSTPFDRVTNQNGAGTSGSTASGRPDGLFNNVIVENDLVDLRSCVNPNGWSLPEVLEKNVKLILDNAKRTEVYRNQPFGGGNAGTTVFMANEIGGTATGAAPGSATQQFDAVRRRFSARPIVEQFTVRLPPISSGLSNGGWVNNAFIEIDPTSLPIYPYAAFNWASKAPSDVMFLEINEMHWCGTAAGNGKYIDALPHVSQVTGLGTKPITKVRITFGSIASLALTNDCSLFVTLTVMYPPGKGLTHTPVETFGTESFKLNTPALSTATPIFYSSMYAQSIDAAHREVRLEYRTLNLLFAFKNGHVPSDTFALPEQAISVQTGTLDESGRYVTLPAPVASGATVSINYVAARPMPALTSPQMAIYFRAAAPQMAPRLSLGTSLSVTPKLSSEKLYALTVGAGSQEESYPYPQAYVQTGGISGALYEGEVDLLGGSDIAVGSFSANTGFLSLPLYVPMATSADGLVLTRTSSDTDIEGRTFFTGVQTTPSPPFGYLPNAFAEDLSAPDRHKNIYPILAELAADSPLGPKGQLVIVMFVRYAAFDDDNAVFFKTDLSHTTSVSVFRVKGLLLNKRA